MKPPTAPHSAQNIIASLLLLLLGTLPLQAQDPRDITPQDGGVTIVMPSEDSSTAGLIVWLVGLLFVIGIAGLIYHDARKNKVPCFGNTFTEEKDPKIWAVICFFFCPGWFYYLFRRTNTLNLATMKTAVETQNAQRSPTETKTEPTIETQLQTLIDLKNKGLITESEFEQKRKQILGL